MMPTPMHAPAAPAGPSPLAAMFQRHAQAGAPQMPHHPGMTPQVAGAPLPLSAGGHPAGRFGHAPSVIPGC